MNFTVNNNTQCYSGNNYVFTNTSSYINGAAFSWNFGDGTTSNDNNPNHTYFSSGTYLVSLVANLSGTDYYKTQIITVLPKTQVTIAANASAICSGTSVTFTATAFNVSGSPVYQWLLNNNEVGSNAATYTNSSLQSSDTVTCRLVASNTCNLTETDTSNPVSVKILTPVPPAVNITTNATTICTTNSVTINANTTNAVNIAAYNFKVNGVSLQNTNSNSFTTKILTDSSVVTVDLTANNSCLVSTVVTSSPLVLRFINVQGNIWTGIADSSFNNKNNWCMASIPSNVIIHSTASKRYPVLTGDITINNISIDSGLSLAIGANTLTINGNIKGTGKFIGSRKSNLILNSTTADTLWLGTSTPGDSTSCSLYNLTINNGTVTLGNALSIYGIINVASGKLDAANNCLTFISDSIGTANLDKVNDGIHGTIANVGNTVIQRYHNNKRAWILMDAPLTTASAISGYKGDIFSNWQKNTYITGPVITGGLDQGPNNSYCLMSWAGNAWANVSNTKGANTLFSNATGDSSASIPYFLFVRGDRTITPAMTTSSTPVTLYARGALQTGTKYVSLPVGYTMSVVANPYPAPLDLTQFINDNPALSISGIATIYYWDPNLSGTGGYTTATYNGSSWQYSSLNTTNTQPGYIQSGQAFFVAKSSSTSLVVFKESQKAVSHSGNAVFGSNNTASLSVNLTRENTFIDGVLSLYNNSYSNAVITPGEDAAKLWSNEEGLSISRDNNYLSIESRPDFINNDTIQFYTRNLKANTNYNFSVTGNNMPSTINAYLIDNYLNSRTNINLESTGNFAFATDSSLASESTSRFMIIFNNKATLAVQRINIKASKKGSAAFIEWNVANAFDAALYTLEHASGNNIFSAIDTTLTTSNSNYSYTDNHAANGDNYYRIKAMAKDGTTTYSAIVKLSFTDITNNQFAVYPNPARTEITVSTSYSNSLLSITDMSGKILISRNLNNTETQLNIDQLRAGIYMVNLHTAEGNKTTRLIVE